MSTADQAVEVLNAAKLAEDGNSKVDHLRALLELVVRKEPQLLPDFLPDVLELQVDPSPAVKRFLPDFIDGALAASPTPPVLHPSLACLQGLLGAGAAVAIAKRALQSCYAAFRTAYTLVTLQGAAAAAEAEGEQGQEPAQLLEVWSAAQALKGTIAELGAAAGGNDAVRLGAVKFLEQAVLLLTADVVPAVAGLLAAPVPVPPGANPVTGGRAVLVRDAEALLGQLVSLLRQRVGEQVSGPVAITAVKAAGGIAQQRPQFMGRLLPPLLAMANSGAYGPATAAAGQGQGPPVGSSVQSSVAAALKAALLGVARSSHPAAQPWRKKVEGALQALGGGSGNAAAAKNPDRPEKRAAPPEEEPSKRLRLDSQHQQQQQLGQPPLVDLQQVQQPPAGAGGVPAAGGGGAGAGAAAAGVVTPPEQLSKVLTVLQALVINRDAAMLAGVVGNLQPGVLADVVMAYMHHLPPPHLLPPDSAPIEPWVLQLLQLIAEQALASTARAGGAQGPAPQQQLEPTAAAAAQPGQAGAGGSIAQDVQQQQRLQQPQEQQPTVAPTVPKPEVAAAKPPAPRPLPPPAAFQLQPLPLTGEQQQQLRLAAVLRILHTDKTSRQQLRTALVAKLAADAGGSTAQAVMRQLVQGISSASSSIDEGCTSCELEVALQWLNVLYAREHAGSSSAGQGEEGPGLKAEEEPGVEGRGGAPLSSSSTAVAAAAAGVQGSAGRAAGATGGRLSPTAAASPYEHTLLELLGSLRQVLPPSSRVIIRVLLEAPALPMPAVGQFLQEVAQGGPDWCTLALLAARDIILQRPPNRSDLLALVLESAACPTPDTRSKAVRLAANRLFPFPSMAPIIEQAARSRLDAMVLPPSPAAEAAAGVGSAPEAHKGEQPLADSSSQAGAGADAENGKAEAASGLTELPPPAGPSDTEAAQLCALYCALCTKKHSLLRHLFEVYGQTSDGGRAAIQRNAGGLAKTLGAAAPALLAVVQDPPAGSLPLVLQMLHVLTEAVLPPQLLVTACLQLYDSRKDARALVPALRGVDRAMALRLLPALLDLPPEQLRPALQRLVAPLPAPSSGSGGGSEEQQLAAAAVVAPEELLSALHTLDHSRDAGLLKKMMQAITVCISSPALFPPESLAACISQLLTRVPLPQLFMRTVIQTVAAAPRLRSFVVGILRQVRSGKEES